MFRLGVGYYKGKWLERNLAKSIEFFKMAEKCGHLHSKHWVSYILRKESDSIYGKVKGYMKLITLAIPFIFQRTHYPNSDRLRA
ncbi:unnamed protein product [Laminaria digitata]